jgi:hypothetical protein
MHSLIKIVSAAALLAACGSSQVPPAKFADAQSKISAADAVGAAHEPRAALHLKMARDQLGQAQQLANDGEDRDAELLIARAKADAEMALMVTREAVARREAEHAQNELKSLSPAN